MRRPDPSSFLCNVCDVPPLRAARVGPRRALHSLPPIPPPHPPVFIRDRPPTWVHDARRGGRSPHSPRALPALSIGAIYLTPTPAIVREACSDADAACNDMCSKSVHVPFMSQYPGCRPCAPVSSPPARRDKEGGATHVCRPVTGRRFPLHRRGGRRWQGAGRTLFRPRGRAPARPSRPSYACPQGAGATEVAPEMPPTHVAGDT